MQLSNHIEMYTHARAHAHANVHKSVSLPSGAVWWCVRQHVSFIAELSAVAVAEYAEGCRLYMLQI